MRSDRSNSSRRACRGLAETYRPRPPSELPDEVVDAFTIAGPVDYAIEPPQSERKLEFLERLACEVAPSL